MLRLRVFTGGEAIQQIERVWAVFALPPAPPPSVERPAKTYSHSRVPKVANDGFRILSVVHEAVGATTIFTQKAAGGTFRTVPARARRAYARIRALSQGVIGRL